MATTGGNLPPRNSLYDGPPGTIPDWVPGGGQPSAEELNKLTAPRIAIAAANTPIPIVYGRDRVQGKCFFVAVDETNGFLYAGFMLCAGPIDSIESIIMDGVDVSAEKGFLSYAAKGAQIQAFTGVAGQPASTLLAAGAALKPGAPTYTDTLPGVAYLAFKCPKDSAKGFPRIEAVVRGRKVYDPRKDDTNGGSGAHRLDNPATWEFSTNPTLCCADYCTQLVGWDVQWDSVADVANSNDVQLAPTGGLMPGGPHKRRELGLTLGAPNSAGSWLSGFRVYMGAYVVWEQGALRFIADRADVEAPYGLLLNRAKSAAPFDYAATPASALPAVGSNPFTVQAQVRLDQTGVDQLICAHYTNSSAAGWYVRFNASNRLQLWMHNGAASVTVTSDALPELPTDDLHEITVEVNRNLDQVTFRMDGEQIGAVKAAVLAGSVDGTGAFYLGGLGTNSNNLRGLLDEVRVWNRLLSAEERAQWAVAEVSPVPASLVAYYKLNSLSGNTARDSSANNRTATVAGSPDWTLGNPQVIPTGVAYHFTPDKIKAETFNLRHRSQRNYPNAIIIQYTDCTAPTGWRTERVRVDSPKVVAGTQKARISQISLPGIHLGPQANRYAIERLNWFLSDLEGAMTVWDEGLNLQVGSIIAITHPMGLNAKLFRVGELTHDSGRWNIPFTEYDPAAYSDQVISEPTIPDTNLGDPLNPPAITGLTAVEELFQYSNGEYGSRVRMTWDATTNPYLSSYVVEGYVNGIRVFQSNSVLNEAVTPPVEELVNNQPVQYQVRVAAQTSFAIGPYASTQCVVRGKLAPPGDVPSLTALRTGAAQVELRWGMAVDIDISYYEVRRAAGESQGNAGWASATSLEQVKGLSYIALNQPTGTFTYYVKARDSVGNYSANVVAATITLTAPPPVAALNGFEVGGEVRLNWVRPAGGEWVERFRISYSQTELGPETTLDIVDTLTFVTRDVAEGSYWFHIRTVDSAGRESTTRASRQIDVSSDQDAFLVDTYQFTGVGGTVSNMHQWTLRVDGATYWVSNMAEAFISNPSTFYDYRDTALANYHSAGSSSWLSEVIDFGLLLTGNWALATEVQSLNGTVTTALELSLDAVTWDSASSAGPDVSIKGAYRYARVRVTASGTATALIKIPAMTIGVKVVPFEETGNSNTLTSGARRITLSQHYTAVKEVYATIVNNSDGCTSVVDNITMGAPGELTYFDVYAFDRFGQQMAKDFQWKFKGV